MQRERGSEFESESLAHISMVEVGPRTPQPSTDFAPTLEFVRQDITDKVVRVAPIEDDTVPFSYEPSEPYDLLEVREVLPQVPRALRASANLVASEPDDDNEIEAPIAPARRSEPLIAVALLTGALAVGVGLSFVVAAITH